ncbi:MAG: type I DNA topoisomerase [Clostridia bacterium]|nr:type I DNA topoisomerase [Clostridia bacterium]
MKLVVIEGPGKQGSIKQYLGKDYTVFATKGHIRDLPEKGLAIDIANGFKPTYQPMPAKKQTIKELKELASKAENVYLATDPDREGEAISWHLAYLLNLDADASCRVTFNEISQKAVLNGIENPRPIDMDLVNAQQARRVLDRLVGYKLSPIISKKIMPKLSAGRVQSVALKLIVDREREILNFVPEEYWTVNAMLDKDNTPFKTLLVLKNGKKYTIKNEAEMQQVLSELKSGNFVVDEVKREVKHTKANPPFITSAMQQDAGQKLKMSLATITRTAQQLYEGVQTKTYGKKALITYIRTDSTRVSDDAKKMAKEFIISNYGEKYAPEKYNTFASKASAQEGHEAIRPIDINITPESIKTELTNDQYKLYKLIYERFLSSQMSDYIYDSLVVDIKNGEYTFRVSGNTPMFNGFKAVYMTEETKDETESDDKLPNLNKNDLLKCLDILYEQKFTKPPTRYTEPTFIKLMEAKGIGRPATYAQTVQILFTRNYCEKDGKFFIPTETGCQVVDFLSEHFKDVMNVKFTAEMEEDLDKISKGKLAWDEVIAGFYTGFEKQLKDVGANVDFEPIKTEIVCDKCGAFMVIRNGVNGKFLACPNYPECKNTKNLDGSERVKEPVIVSDEKCEKCGANLVKRSGKNGDFLACPNYPKCKFTKNILTKSSVLEREKEKESFIETEEICNKCGAKMVIRSGRNGKFLACPNFPKCKNTMSYVEPKKVETTEES